MSIRFLAWPLALFFALLLGGCGGKDVQIGRAHV